ncbi:MAG: hypothetical protein L6461_22470 [Anaerolineae bacterium]|nr:hypothetical protein [Anaerolineae bacterium]
MLHWLGYQLLEIYDPFRLLKSHLFLIGFGTALAASLTWYWLPRFWKRLPSDLGRLYAVGANQSMGKPVGAGCQRQLEDSVGHSIASLLVDRDRLKTWGDRA